MLVIVITSKYGEATLDKLVSLGCMEIRLVLGYLLSHIIYRLTYCSGVGSSAPTNRVFVMQV